MTHIRPSGVKRASNERYIPRTRVNEQRIERWLGKERMAELRALMHTADGTKWHGPPINIRDIPGSVWLDRDGDFVGEFSRGFFYSAADAFDDFARRLWRESGRVQHGYANAGFASISEALSRASQGYRQPLYSNKVGPTGVTGGVSWPWRLGNMPVAGSAPAAAPGGTAFSSSSTGALPLRNPASGTLHLTGADLSTNTLTNLMLFDLVFGVAKTMNSTTTEAVTGVPTRYQSSTTTDEDYSGGNFLNIMVGGTALAATAHNWTTCLYTDQDGNTGATLPSVTGNSGAIVDRADIPLNQWWCPLASGDSGIKALTQMQCSAAVATGVIWFIIGHPIGMMAFPAVNTSYPFDWLTNRDQAPRIFNAACLTWMELAKPSTGAATINGNIYITNAAP